MHKFSPELDRNWFGWILISKDTTANAIAGFEHDYCLAGDAEVTRGSQTGSMLLTYDGIELKDAKDAGASLAGSAGSDYWNWTPRKGTHVLEAVPFSGTRSGAGKVVSFRVVDDLVTTPTPKPEPKPTEALHTPVNELERKFDKTRRYRVIGADQKVYGPIDGGKVLEWIADERINWQTPSQIEGTGEWKPLSAWGASPKPPAIALPPPIKPAPQLHKVRKR